MPRGRTLDIQQIFDTDGHAMQGAKRRTIHYSLFGAPGYFVCIVIQDGCEAIQTRLLLICSGEDRF